jgi:hypothetical protein
VTRAVRGWRPKMKPKQQVKAIAKETYRGIWAQKRLAKKRK